MNCYKTVDKIKGRRGSGNINNNRRFGWEWKQTQTVLFTRNYAKNTRQDKVKKISFQNYEGEALNW